MMLMLVSCTDNETSNNENEAKIRLVNVSQKAFDSLILQYEDNMRYAEIYFSQLSPEDTSQYKLMGSNYRNSINFYCWADSVDYTGNWEMPSSTIDPMNPSHNYYPTGYYTFTIIEADDSTQTSVVGLTDFYLY